MMRGVLGPIGTAASAAIPGVKAWGKTGTTSNYEDAWFVGSIPRIGNVPSMTIAVWVGYPNKSKPMRKNFGGKPVYGGTFPAEIWRTFVEQMLGIYHDRAGRHRTGLRRRDSRPRATARPARPPPPRSTTGTTGVTGTTTTTGAPTGGDDVGDRCDDSARRRHDEPARRPPPPATTATPGTTTPTSARPARPPRPRTRRPPRPR